MEHFTTSQSIINSTILFTKIIQVNQNYQKVEKGRTISFLRPSNPNINNRELHSHESLITIPQQLIGEGIKPTSVRILDNISDVTTDIRDDGDGNLYDFSFSSSYGLQKIVHLKLSSLFVIVSSIVQV